MLKDFYRDYLFSKNILVSDAGSVKNEDVFYTLFAIASKYNIRIKKGSELANMDVLKYLEKQIPGQVTPAFYRGFPESVRQLTREQLLLDQLLHYFDTYGSHNEGEVFEGDAAASLFEENFERVAFKESTTVKNFEIVDEKQAIQLIKKYADDVLQSTRPLSEGGYELVSETVLDFGHGWISGVASRNTAFRLLLDMQDFHWAKYFQLSDVLKLVEQILHDSYSNSTLKKLNLKNSDRKFITKVLDYKLCKPVVHKQQALCFERRADWKGLLHHIHYKPRNADAAQFVSDLRNSKNISAMSDFEKLMSKGEVVSAAAVLGNCKGSGAILRSLNYILSRCTDDKDVARVIELIKSDNPVMLLQLIMQYGNYVEDRSARTFTFTKYYKLKNHRETASEQQSRKSFVSEGTRKLVVDALWNNVREIYKNKLGKVYIDEAMKNLAVPMQETTAETGYGILPKGTRIHIPEGKVVRAFTYWEKVNDIDLSAMGVTSDGKQIEFSWRSMYDRQSPGVTFSGDQTRGFNGGSEYFDFNLDYIRREYPTMKYIVLCNNVFSGTPFSKCTCRAGYMLRDRVGSGEIWEPKTVESSYTISGDSTYSYMFAIDVEKNDFVWLNMCKDSMARVAGDTDFTFLAKYIGMTDIINVYSLFEMMATEIVTDRTLADVIVSDEEVELTENQEQIKSTDTERILRYLNNK